VAILKRPNTNVPAPASNVPAGIVTAYALTIEGRQKFWFCEPLASVGYNSLYVPVLSIVCLQDLVL
jgi:3-deoxy-D-manno-octulosonic acid (KDO) 8-phosphate synthase